MSLRDDVALYTELSGNDGNHTPIGIIGAYLDGYEKGKVNAQPEPKNKLISEIEGKTPEETYDFLVWLLNDYGMRFTDSRQAVIEWLRGEQDG